MATSKKEQRNKVLIIIIGTIVLVGLYLFFSNQNNKKREQAVIAEQVQKILDSDIEMDYPSSPREVIIQFNKILACYYKEKLDDDTLKKLMAQERVLFDQQLLDQNSIENQLKDLKAEILDFQKAKRSIVTSTVAKSSSVEYETKDGKEYASIIASYTLKDSEVVKTYEKYILRKDDQGKWRILGWEVTSSTDTSK
ncbi:DUF6715 family protein [Anaerosporobacter sp.]|uniref:DUF6715 family protein n=1 Tax=Anaerosporobacter sp. TaxID=1872529 RepID=UPI00286FA460|nr:DUF6715 family protein [Anaerosporobacter sp.]